MRARALVVLALGGSCVAAAARAQSVEAAIGGLNTQRLVQYRGSAHEQNGQLYGGSGALQVGRLRLGVSGHSGTLAADSGAPNADVSIRTTALAAHVALSPSLLVGVQWEGRRFASDAGVVFWRLAGPSARFEPEFGIAGLRGVAEVAVLSASAVRDGPTMRQAIQTTMGASFTPPGGRLQARLAYRFERYDIAGSGVTSARYEEYRGVVVEMRVAVGRR